MKNSCEWCSIDLKRLRSICLNWMTSCNYMLMLKFILNCCILIPPFHVKISCNKAGNKIQEIVPHVQSRWTCYVLLECFSLHEFLFKLSKRQPNSVIIRSKYRIKEGRGLIPSTFILVCLSLCVIKIYAPLVTVDFSGVTINGILD